MSDNIPVEVQIDIVRRLPVKRILQCRSVSKSWKARIDTLHFTARCVVSPANSSTLVLCYRQGFKGYISFLHDDFSRTEVPTNFSYSDLKPIGYSHGVLGFSYGPIVPDYMGFFWNPPIRRSCGTFVAYLHNMKNMKSGCWHLVLLFTFSSREWNPLQTEFLPRQSIRLKKASQCVVGGHIFWCGYERLYGDDGSTFKSYMMVSFSLVTYHFQELEIPAELLVNLPLPFQVSNLRDNIVVSRNINRDDHFVFCIWLLTVVGGTIASFQCMLNIPTPCQLKLIGFDGNNDPILEFQNPEGWVTTLGVYKIASGTFHNLGIEGDAGSFFISPYCESIILQTHVDRSRLSKVSRPSFSNLVELELTVIDST
ncbi:F-box domain-containing protein [Artemisia annua]|uniref:F-box domain-containing protein n=1 Tax=Artemisia annua TaxID=35608 RepID=A0A2U1PX02_ARTAN|nr:F-box domain-containing protein [Artemisia annua]